MKIIIAGAGDVGYHLAELLADEQQDIILIDKNKESLKIADEKMDVMTVGGNAASIDLLEEIGVNSADLVIAATQSETTNITIGVLAKQLGAKRCIIRVENEEYLDDSKSFSWKSLGIDSIISPAVLATEEIENLLELPGVTDVVEFSSGCMKVIGVHLTDGNAPILNKTVIEAAKGHNKELMPVAIHRNRQTLIPRGNSKFQVDDFAYFACKTADVQDLLKLTGKHEVRLRTIMIVGGSQIGRQTAELLSKHYKVKLIEQDRKKCEVLADELPNVLIIHGDARDVDLLREEHIEDMDVFIAVTGNSETNIMSSLMAKSMGVGQTIALVENTDYIHISQNIGVDTLINKKLLAAAEIFKYVRVGGVLSVNTLHGVDAEILEFDVKEKSKITKAVIRDLNFPSNAVIGGVIRGDESFRPLGNFQVQAKDKVIVFTKPDDIREVERFFK